MSKTITTQDLLNAFPYELSGTDQISMIAAIVAEELSQLSEDNNLLEIYTRIDELDSDILDILAYDFKIDWWDHEADIDSKRKTFKSCFSVHRQLGSIGAVKKAVSDMYSTALIEEWNEYGGMPYHYRLSIDLDHEFATSEIFQKIIYRAKFYTNVRSVMDSISFKSLRKRQLYIGLAVQTGTIAVFNVPGVNMTLLTCLTDENGELLMDETNDILLE